MNQLSHSTAVGEVAEYKNAVRKYAAPTLYGYQLPGHQNDSGGHLHSNKGEDTMDRLHIIIHLRQNYPRHVAKRVKTLLAPHTEEIAQVNKDEIDSKIIDDIDNFEYHF